MTVVFRIAAIAHYLIRLDPNCRCSQQFQYLLAAVFGQNPLELWPSQHFGNLSPRCHYRVSGTPSGLSAAETTVLASIT